MPSPAVVVVLLSAIVACSCSAAPAVSNLRAQCRQGQVFLTWDEPPGLQGTLTVLASPAPITTETARQATVIAHHLNPGSASDWWLNPETYGAPLEKDPKTGQKPPIPHEGFVIEAGGARLNPDSGLHVHTVGAGETGPRHFAVVAVAADGTVDWDLVPGANALAAPVEQTPAPVEPIWVGAGTPPDPTVTKGLPVHLQLHAKRGKGGQEWLAFGDATLGWREGLPFKFGVYLRNNAVVVIPTDRTWIGRMFPEGTDECQRLTPALHSFWYGYNDHIYDRALMPQGTVVNYTERRLLWILEWVHRTYQTDRQRVYAYGSSMGGCGDIDVCLRHPEVFAAIRAHVPIVAYDKGKGGNSEVRVVAETGGMEMPTNEGMTVRERLDGTRFVREHKGDLPFLVITNGRQDASIPWWKNPDFYRTLRDRRQAFVAAWDDGAHGTCAKDMPADIKSWDNLASFSKLFALNKSYLAFSNGSHDNNPGNGDPHDGDIVGFMNRGLTWEEPRDTADKYEVLVKWMLVADRLPVTVDVTVRRLQAFKPGPGQAVTATNLAADTGAEVQAMRLTVDEQGLVTFPGFRITAAAGNRIVLQPAQ